MNFSFITRISIPISRIPGSSRTFWAPLLAFSADGSKFAIAMDRGIVSVWDIQKKVPLKTFMDVPKSSHNDDPLVQYLQFSSGQLGKEVLVFVEVCSTYTF